ncbi:Protein quaking [Collichthys lucidus]|uniref:Protein quaking n=1 Tax=Collichthys lucidus TaxID=240159 RepID=A0A4U5TU96_COLLU|nr:Protein quaking [Collichthys lucidus]
MVGDMEGKEKPRPGPDYLMQLMNDKKLMSSLPNFCGIFQHLERLLDQGDESIECDVISPEAGRMSTEPRPRSVLLQNHGLGQFSFREPRPRSVVLQRTAASRTAASVSCPSENRGLGQFSFREPRPRSVLLQRTAASVSSPSENHGLGQFSFRTTASVSSPSENRGLEISRVRKDMYIDALNGSDRVSELPDAVGPNVQLQEKLYVPTKEHPDFNFVGRILGPRGLTAKQLEAETGCKIMVRGRGSMRDRKKNRGKPNWEHLNEDLHVLITVEDAQNRAEIKLKRAMEEVNKLLVPAAEGEDSLKKMQLMELAILNGTCLVSSQAPPCRGSTNCPAYICFHRPRPHASDRQIQTVLPNGTPHPAALMRGRGLSPV